MKALLITISTITLLLFTSCEKDEMDKGIGAGNGGMDSPYTTLNVENLSFNEDNTNPN